MIAVWSRKFFTKNGPFFSLSNSGFSTEKILLDRGADLSADLWIRGQHTSAPSGLKEFVAAVSPKAIISTNATFPAKEQLSEEWKTMIGEMGIRLFDLSECGTVTASFSDSEMTIQPFLKTGGAVVVWETEE